MFNVPNKYRLRKHPTMGSDDSYGNNGMFIVPYDKLTLNCLASDGIGWEHVSVTVKGDSKPPSWGIMCYVKDLFWGDEDCIIQYHPPKYLYVNNHPYCLHLWQPTNVKIPIPDPKLVGVV